MKYIIYLLLIIPNLIWAETLICDDDADARNNPTYIKYERVGDKFIWSSNATRVTSKMTILNETDKRLHLVDSNTVDVINAFIFNKETNRYHYVNIWFDSKPFEWKGSCKVVE